MTVTRPAVATEVAEPTVRRTRSPPRAGLVGTLILIALTLFFVGLFLRMVFPPCSSLLQVPTRPHKAFSSAA